MHPFKNGGITTVKNKTVCGDLSSNTLLTPVTPPSPQKRVKTVSHLILLFVGSEGVEFLNNPVRSFDQEQIMRRANRQQALIQEKNSY